MFLWGVVVLGLDSLPDHYKVPDQYTTWAITVYGNELLLFRIKAFLLLILLISSF